MFKIPQNLNYWKFKHVYISSKPNFGGLAMFQSFSQRARYKKMNVWGKFDYFQQSFNVEQLDNPYL